MLENQPLKPTDEQVRNRPLPPPPPPGVIDPEFGLPRRKANPVWETMTRIKIGNFTIRVWREEAVCKSSNQGDPEVVEAISNVKRRLQGYKAVDFIEAVCQLPRISAVEVLYATTGCGVLFYPDWK